MNEVKNGEDIVKCSVKGCRELAIGGGVTSLCLKHEFNGGMNEERLNNIVVRSFYNGSYENGKHYSEFSHAAIEFKNLEEAEELLRLARLGLLCKPDDENLMPSERIELLAKQVCEYENIIFNIAYPEKSCVGFCKCYDLRYHKKMAKDVFHKWNTKDGPK